MAGIVVIPDASGWGQSTVDRGTLNDTQSRISEVQLAVCGYDEPLRWGYGRNRVGALWLKPVSSTNYLYLPFVIAAGPIDAVEKLELGNTSMPSGITVQTYLGAADQTADPSLVAAWAAQGQPYGDTLPNIAYGVLRVAASVTLFPTDITITARMRKVYDPRVTAHDPDDASTWEYSTNPALCLADFLASSTYGRGETVDWDSVAVVADVCDQTVGSAARRSISLMFDTIRGVTEVEDVLRSYAGCWVVREGGVARLVADAPASPVFAFTNAAGSANYLAGSLRLSQKRRADLPTVVSVAWTDTSVTPWASRTHTEKAPGVVAGTLPWREEAIQMPGLQVASQARREAIRRLNGYLASDLTARLVGCGEAIELRVGDVVTVTDSEGLTDKAFRLTEHSPREPGLWQETLVEYDASVYSDAIADGPTTPDTTLPLPTEPPAVTGLALAEELYQLRDGTWKSRIRATWDAVEWPFTRHYAVTVWSRGVVVWSALVDRATTTYATGTVQDGETYQVDVAIISTVSSVGTADSTAITAAGKLLPPEWPAGARLKGFEAGGKVFLWWTAASDIDVSKYEIRYGLVAGSYASATTVNRIDALHFIAEGLPVGDWRFYVEAYDSVGSPTGSPLTLDLTVTLDSNAFLVQQYQFLSPTPTNMTVLQDRRGYLTLVTDFGDGLGFGADNTDNDVGTFGDSLKDVPFAHPHTAGTSSVESESWDIGYTVSGNFRIDADYTDLSGTATLTIRTSTDDANWTDTVGGSVRTTARFVRGKIETTGTMTLTAAYARVDVVPKRETGTVTTAASGATTVTLSNEYATAKAIQLTPSGTAARQAVYDNVVVGIGATNSFDVYLFNASGTQIAGDVSWVFDGI